MMLAGSPAIPSSNASWNFCETREKQYQPSWALQYIERAVGSHWRCPSLAAVSPHPPPNILLRWQFAVASQHPIYMQNGSMQKTYFGRKTHKKFSTIFKHHVRILLNIHASKVMTSFSWHKRMHVTTFKRFRSALLVWKELALGWEANIAAII